MVYITSSEHTELTEDTLVNDTYKLFVLYQKGSCLTRLVLNGREVLNKLGWALKFFPWVQAPTNISLSLACLYLFSSLTFMPPWSSKHLNLCCKSPSSLSSLAWQASCSSGVAGGRKLATMTRVKLFIHSSKFFLSFKSRPFPCTSLKWLPSPAIPLLPHILPGLPHILDVAGCSSSALLMF